MLQITGNAFNKTSIPLKYTPRRFVFHEPSKKFIIIETDRNVLSTFERDYQTQRLVLFFSPSPFTCVLTRRNSWKMTKLLIKMYWISHLRFLDIHDL